MPGLHTQHPDSEKLTAFGLGRLSEADSKDIEQHLADCAECRTTLDNLPGDSLVDLLQASAAGSQESVNLSGPSADTDSSSPSKESIPPLYKKLAQIIGGKPAEQNDKTTAPKAAPAATLTAKPGFTMPRELEAHSRYLVLEPLGAGGMGTVYKAQHRLMERVVALKIVNQLLVTKPGAVERFTREVKAAAQLVHPNIVTAFDAEKVGEMHLLVMEYVEGRTLAQVIIDERELPVAKACDYVRQTALGLQYALGRGMVHRDIKPQNLMLTPTSEIKILDFGLARFVSEQAQSDGSTEHGSLMGSPDYMAPEQAHDAHTADQRADIYSMGCTLYQLLAGQVPFPEASMLAKLEAHRDKQPIPLNHLRLDVPADLAKVVEKMMAKDPAQRYQKPAEVAAALAPFTHAPYAAPKVQGQPSVGLSKQSSRRPTWAMAAVALLLLVPVAFYAGPAVYRFATNQGVVIVEANDEDVEVVVKQNGKIIAIIDKKSGQTVTIQAGKYEVELGKGKEILKLTTNEFSLSRGGREIVRVRRELAQTDPPKKIPDPKGSRQLKDVVDLSKAKVLANEDFADPKKSAFGWGEFAQTFKDSRIFLHDGQSPLWSSSGYRFENFVCEATGSVVTPPHNGWGIGLLDIDAEKKGGLEVVLDSQGDLHIVPTRLLQDKSVEMPSAGPIRIANFKKNGERNSLTVIVRDGRTVEVFVNGIEACDPINLKRRISPVQVYLASRGGSKGSVLAFESFKVWSLASGPALPSVEELLKTREVLTVAQDGSGSYKTIQAALDKVQANQVIHVKDKGPYRELLRKELPPNVAMISKVGTRIDIPKFEAYDEAPEKGKFWYRGSRLTAQSGFHLSGFELTGSHERPADLIGGMMFQIDVAGDVILENCSLQGPTFMTGLTITGLGKPARVLVQDNLANQGLEFHPFPGTVTIQRNWISSTYSALYLNQNNGLCNVQHNVIQADIGISFFLRAQQDKIGTDSVDLHIHNNVIETISAPVVFHKVVKDNCLLPRSAHIVNNVIRSQVGAGIVGPAEIAKALKDICVIGPNAYQDEPKALGASPLIAAGAGNVMMTKHFLSVEPAHANFFRIAVDGPLAVNGAGKGLPTYFGAFPPGPAPKDGDWFTRLQEVAKRSPSPPIIDTSNKNITLVSIEELLKTRKVLIVAQDGADYKTIQSALDKVQAGQVILVKKGKTPYREMPRATLPADVALLSLDGAQIEVTPSNANNPNGWYWGADFKTRGNFRLSGLTWISANIPKGAPGVVLLNLWDLTSADRTIENCAFLGELTDPSIALRIRGTEDMSSKVLVQDCYFAGRIEAGFGHVDMTLQRNWFAKTVGACDFNSSQSGRITVRHNVFQTEWGFRIVPPLSDHVTAKPGIDLLVHNNVFDVDESPVSSFYPYNPDFRELGQLCRSVKIFNNIMHSRKERGMILLPLAMDKVKDQWTLGPNVYSMEPKGDGQWKAWPKQPNDLVLPLQIFLPELKDANYVRIPLQGDLATKGAGGELPSYFGAFPPGPAPKEGDWFTRLLDAHRKSSTVPSVKDLLAKAKAASDANQFEQVIGLCNEVLSKEPKNIDAIYLRVWPQWNLGKRAEAIEDVTAVLKHNPDHLEARQYRSFYYLNTGKLDECIADADIFLSKDKSSRGAASIFGNRGGAWALKGRFEKGLADFEAATKIDLGHAVAYHWQGMILERLGEHAKAKVAYDNALKLDKSFATYGKDRLDHVIPQPMPLAEWRTGREFVTVAQKGPADHRTIQDALRAVKKGQFIKVLDKGPYRETILHGSIADIALVSEVGTSIEVPKWHEWGPSPTAKKKKLYQGFHFGSPNGLRLSGFEFRLPPVPADAEYVVAVDIESTGDVIVESCQVRFHRDVLAGLSEDDKQQVGRFIGLNMLLDSQGAVKTGRFLVQDNLIDGKVLLHGNGPVYATVQRNWIRQPTTDSLDLPNYAGSEGTVRHNVIQGHNGIAMRARESEKAGANAGRYLIANNLMNVVHCPVWSHAVAATQEKDRPDRQTVCRAVTVQNNITLSKSGSGLELHADDLKAMTGVWKIGHNSFSATPKHVGPGAFPVFALQATDKIVAGPFLSDDPKHADYFRIDANGKLATGGIGGVLPSYIGPFPPGPAPKDGDWFTRLRDASKHLAAAPSVTDLLAKARAAENQKKDEQAITICTDILRMEPRNVEALWLRGICHLHLEHWPESLQDLSATLELDANSEARGNRVHVYLRMGKLDECIADATILIDRKSPSTAGVLVNRAVAFGSKGRFDRALADYDRLLKLEPKRAEFLLNRSFVHERLGNAMKAKADFDGAVAAKPELKNVRSWILDVVPQPMPLGEWLQGREVLTVSQDGKAMFKTIGAAIDKLKPGQVIKVLDKGPYRERLNRDLPENVGLISEVGTRIEWEDWLKSDAHPGDPKKFTYLGMILRCPRNLRLAGFDITGAKADPNAGFTIILAMTADGDVVVESCRITMADTSGGRIDFMNWSKSNGNLWLRENDFGRHLSLNTPGSSVVAERNRMRDPHFETAYLWPGAPPRELVFRRNVMQGKYGIRFGGFGGNPEPGAWDNTTLLFANNYCETESHVLWFNPGDESKKGWYPPKVRIHNNIMHSKEQRGIILTAKGLSEVKDAWKVSHNSYQNDPSGIGNLAAFPRQATDLKGGAPFLSVNPGEANYLRIAVNNPMATAGVGGSLPTYIGPLPPGPAPKDGDWFTRLQGTK